MKNKHLLVGRELGRKKWTLKIGAINVAIFGKYAADFGFLALVTLRGGSLLLKHAEQTTQLTKCFVKNVYRFVNC